MCQTLQTELDCISKHMEGRQKFSATLTHHISILFPVAGNVVKPGLFAHTTRFTNFNTKPQFIKCCRIVLCATVFPVAYC